MICIFPVFIADDAQWRMFADNQDVLAELALSLADSPQIEAVHVVYGAPWNGLTPMEHPKVREHIMPQQAPANVESGIARPDVHPRHDGQSEGQELLPPGTGESLTWLVEGGLVDRKAPVCVIDFRNPLLTALHIEQALTEHTDIPGGIHSSAFKALDHPCQANIPYSVEFSGIVHLLDRSATLPPDAALHLGQDAAVTLPFTFDWGRRNIAAHPGSVMHLKRDSDAGVSYDPVLTPAHWDAARSSRVLWRIADDQARWVYPQDSWKQACPASDAAGSSLPGDAVAADPGFTVHAVKDREGKGFTLILEPAFSRSRHLRVRTVPLNISGPVLENFSEANLPSGVLTMNIPCSTVPDSGFLVTVLAESTFDAIDLLLPYIPEQPLWIFDYRSSQRIRCDSGQPITGRQAFPDVFQPDGSFTIATAEELLDMPAAGASRLHLHPIPPESAKTATYQLCLMRRKIRTGSDLRV